jgi:predicted secreted Zn-dependent protease
MQDHLERAIALARMGRRAAARDLLRVVLRRDPNNLAAWKLHAMLARDSDQARAALRRALELAPEDEWARKALARLESKSAEPAPEPEQTGVQRAPGQMALMIGLVVMGVLALLGATASAVWLTSRESATPTPQIERTKPPAAQPAPASPLPEEPADGGQPLPEWLEAIPTTSSSVFVTGGETYYTVGGSTFDEIFDSVLANGPYSERLGRAVPAVTNYTTSLDWTPHQADGTCRPSQVAVTVDIVYTLPKWEAPPGISPDVRAEWEEFYSLVEQHEYGHGQIAAACADELAEAVALMLPQPDCETLDAAIRTKGEEIRAECRARELQFEQSDAPPGYR